MGYSVLDVNNYSTRILGSDIYRMCTSKSTNSKIVEILKFNFHDQRYIP